MIADNRLCQTIVRSLFDMFHVFYNLKALIVVDVDVDVDENVLVQDIPFVVINKIYHK